MLYDVDPQWVQGLCDGVQERYIASKWVNMEICKNGKKVQSGEHTREEENLTRGYWETIHPSGDQRERAATVLMVPLLKFSSFIYVLNALGHIPHNFYFTFSDCSLV